MKFGLAQKQESHEASSFLMALIDKGYLEYIDLFSAEHLLKEASEAELFFMAYLLKASREGHLCISLEKNQLVPNFITLWDVERDYEALLREGAASERMRTLLVQQGECWYLPRLWQCEETLLRELDRIAHSAPQPPFQIGDSLPWKLYPEQQQALALVAEQSVTCISGGPGSGKSFIAACLIELFLQHSPQAEVIVAAPTGKAAMNLRLRLRKELAAQCRIQTLHALLESYKAFPRYPTLSADLLIVDECSMLDARLFAHLAASVKRGARLVLCGDPQQLPPISSGALFADLLCAGRFPQVHLEGSVRVENQKLHALAQAIQRGEFCWKHVDLKPLPASTKGIAQWIAQWIESLAQSFVAGKEQHKRFLTPLRQGPFGVDALNALMHAKCLFYAQQRGVALKVPLLMTVNQPKLDLYNGDSGLLEGERVSFEHRSPLPLNLLPQHELGYFLSVHKSQGSEYEEVHLLLPEGCEIFGREMLYTAVTRAKKKVVIYGTRERVELLLCKKNERHSGIKSRI